MQTPHQSTLRACLVAAMALTISTTTEAQHGDSAPAAPIRALLAAPVATRAALSTQFWEERRSAGSPISEPVGADSLAVTFVLRGSPDSTANAILFGGPANLGDSPKMMTNVIGTDVWYHTITVPARARYLYRFSVNDTVMAEPHAPASARFPSFFVLDSLNRRSAPYSPGASGSVFEGRDAPSLAMSVPVEGRPSGSVTSVTLQSKQLGQVRNLKVYLPPGYAPSTRANTPLIVLFDAGPYTSPAYVPTATIMDNLIAEHRIPPAVVVMVDTPQPGRYTDLWPSRPFADFVATELIPWARTTYAATSDPLHTVIGGSSLGGLTATYVAMHYPRVAGLVLSQSGSYWTGMKQGADTSAEWVRRTLADMPRLPIRFWMEVGDYESRLTNPVGMEATNRRLRDLLKEKGYRVSYREFAGGHEYINWRASLPAALTELLAP